MSVAKRLTAFRALGLVLVALCAVALGGCELWTLITGGVQFNKIIEGELTYTDNHSPDSNDLIFYSDRFEVRLDAGKTYSLELWTAPDVPIHFECDELGQDLGAWSDGDKTWDGYLLYEIPSSFSGKLSFDFYVRADHVDSDSWYKFRINET